MKYDKMNYDKMLRLSESIRKTLASKICDNFIDGEQYKREYSMKCKELEEEYYDANGDVVDDYYCDYNEKQEEPRHLIEIEMDK